MNAEEPVPRRKGFTRRAVVGAALLVTLGSGYALWQHEKPPEFLHVAESDFVALFAAPPAADSPQTRRRSDEHVPSRLRLRPQGSWREYQVMRSVGVSGSVLLARLHWRSR